MILSVIEISAPAPLPTQVPPIAKQPPERLMPTFDVVVAEPKMLRPERVVVANPVAEMESAVVEALVTASNILPVVSPHAVSFAYGEVVPMPTLPAVSIMNLVGVPASVRFWI